MKRSLAGVAALLIGGSATGASAIVATYFGSDSLFNVTNNVIANLGITPATAYVAGGSGAGQNAMLAQTQATAPMSKMLTNGACSFQDPTSAGLGAGSASGIVVGLDAVDVLVASSQLDTATCNGTADNSGTGLAYSGTSGVFAGSGAAQNWKWLLALVYGGLDYSTGVVDCNQTSRRNLVNSWSNLFQNSGTCANTTAICQSLASAGDGTHTPLLHAFRRDDASGTSDVFASILGLSPSPSQTAVNGFGASPYCNALNWDVTSDTTGTCALGNHDQFSGPGGIVDPLSKCTIGTIGASPVCGAAGSGNHRMPPLVPAAWNNNAGGVWGLNPNVTKAACNHQVADPTQCIWDVLPTDMQDNDPIRRPCQGIGKTGGPVTPGEEVCNLDSALGLVLAIPSSDFIGRPAPTGLGLPQYPSGTCGPLLFGNPPHVFTCAPANVLHPGECPNGDSLVGGQCSVPVLKGTGAAGSVGQVCSANKTTISNFTNRTNLGVAGGNPAGSPDGRAFNLHMYRAAPDGMITYIEQVVQNVVSGVSSPIARDFVGGMGRIHTFETMITTAATGCQMLDATDQIGCLVQADPCSIGYAGDGAKTWNTRPDGPLTPPVVSGTDAARIAQIYPTATTVNLLGQSGEYPLGRKLYFNSLIGFGHVATDVLASGVADPDELAVGEFESSYTANATSFASILAADSYFQVTAGPLGNAPFCEDFNEGTVCQTSTVTAVNAQNACTTNVGLTGHGATVPSEPVSATSLTAPTQSTVCGNGRVEAYEECDDGTANGTAGDTCSTTCRCAGVTTFHPGETPLCQ
jgi:cysteine-rich repeat protein